MTTDRPIVVAGAGSIGCFVGGMLAAAGRSVGLLARARVIDEIESNGLTVTSFEGFARKIAGSQLILSDDSRILGDADIVLVTVKSADTAEVAEAIARRAMPSLSVCKTASAMCRCCASDYRGGLCSRRWCHST